MAQPSPDAQAIQLAAGASADYVAGIVVQGQAALSSKSGISCSEYIRLFRATFVAIFHVADTVTDLLLWSVFPPPACPRARRADSALCSQRFVLARRVPGALLAHAALCHRRHAISSKPLPREPSVVVVRARARTVPFCARARRSPGSRCSGGSASTRG